MVPSSAPIMPLDTDGGTGTIMSVSQGHDSGFGPTARIQILKWFRDAELLAEPPRGAAVAVADGVGDGPVEFPLLDVGPLVTVLVAQERVLECASEAAAEVHDRGW